MARKKKKTKSKDPVKYVKSRKFGGLTYQKRQYKRPPEWEVYDYIEHLVPFDLKDEYKKGNKKLNKMKKPELFKFIAAGWAFFKEGDGDIVEVRKLARLINQKNFVTGRCHQCPPIALGSAFQRQQERWDRLELQSYPTGKTGFVKGEGWKYDKETTRRRRANSGRTHRRQVEMKKEDVKSMAKAYAKARKSGKASPEELRGMRIKLRKAGYYVSKHLKELGLEMAPPKAKNHKAKKAPKKSKPATKKKVKKPAKK